MEAFYNVMMIHHESWSRVFNCVMWTLLLVNITVLLTNGLETLAISEWNALWWSETPTQKISSSELFKDLYPRPTQYHQKFPDKVPQHLFYNSIDKLPIDYPCFEIHIGAKLTFRSKNSETIKCGELRVWEFDTLIFWDYETLRN